MKLMKIKIFTLTAFLPILIALICSYAYAIDVSIDRVKINEKVVAESQTNFIKDADIFSVVVDFTTLATLEKGHVEAILRGRQTGDVVSNSTGTFDLAKNVSSTSALNLVLIDSLKRETEFDLTTKIVDARGNSQQKTFGIKTKQTRLRGILDVSIGRVKVNGKVVAVSRTNFIDESKDFDVLVEFTALEDLENAHIEAILRDLKSSSVIADASPNFNLAQDLSSSRLLRLELLDKLKQSNSFELTVRIVDADGNSIQQLYGIQMRDKIVNGAGGAGLDISIDSVEAESKVIAENEKNFIPIGESKKNLGLTIRLTSLENVKNTHIDAVLTFENGDSVADATEIFDLDKSQHTTKKLELPLIGKFRQSNFKLRLKIADAEGNSKEKSYELKLSNNKLPSIISSISLSPENRAEAGKNIEVGLSLKDISIIPLESLNVKVSIPELDVSSSKSIQIKNGIKAREEFILKIPESAQTGDYSIRLEITSEFGDGIDAKDIPIFIVGKDEQTSQEVSSKLLISVPILKQDIYSNATEAIYPITLKNDGTRSNAYTILLDDMNWANLRLSDLNVFILKPQESKTLNIYASPKANAAGEQTFIVTIKSGDKVLKQIQLNGNVAATEGISPKVKSILWAALIVSLVIIAAIASFFGIRKIMGGGKDDIEESGDFSGEIPDKADGESYY